MKEKNLEFYIKDSGIGLESELKDKIFERFRQADLSMSRPYEGTGLGLSISKSFVEMLDGKIWLESEPGKGSTFFFTIPYNISAKYKESKRIKAYDASKLLVDITILIAEDDETSLLFLKEVLDRSGINLLFARDGKKTIEMIRTNPKIDLVLMDIKMPKMNGYEATRQIKQIRPTLPVIAQTAFASLLDKQKSLDAGCDDYISKPINKDVLFEMVKKYT
ncbi:Aerobic respiration control sensor protein ArcB [subsurface metagenome]